MYSKVNDKFFNPHYERMKRGDLESLQLTRLKATIKHVYETIPFYRKLYETAGVSPADIKEIRDIQKFPFTTKTHLRDNYPFGMLAVPLEETVEIHASSGTTGTPTVAFYTPNDIDYWSNTMARCLTMANLTKEDVFQITPSFSLFTGGFGFYYGARKIGATIVPTGPGFSRRQIRVMVDLKVSMLAGIVSYALRLAEVAQEMGIDPIRDTGVRKGIFGSEMWSQAMKKRIADTWNMDVYDIYGLTEAYGPGTSADCYLHDGLHLWEDHFLLEIIDPKTGHPVEPEEEGEIVLTSLTKEAVPIIRYRTRDISYLYDAVICECGRTHRRHGPIKGKSDDTLKVKGVNIWPSQVEQVLIGLEGVSGEYQLVVDKVGALDQLTVRIEASKDSDKARKGALVTKLTSDLRDVMRLTPIVEILEYGAFPREISKPKRAIDRRLT